MEILEISRLQYCLGFDSSWKCSLSDYYVNIGKKIFVLTDHDEPVSYAIVSVGKYRIQVMYIFTPEAKRNKGYAAVLIRKLKAKSDCVLTAEINTDWHFYHAAKRCFEKCGAEIKIKSRVYSVNVSSQYYRLYRKQNPEKTIEYLTKKGFECMSFAQMTEDIRNQIYNSSESDFGNPFNTKPYFDIKAYQVDYDYSMVLVKDGKLRAYILCTRSSDDTLFLEHTSEAKTDIGNGIIAFPFFVLIGKIFERDEIKKLCYTVSNANARSLGLVQALNQNMPVKATDTASFYFPGPVADAASGTAEVLRHGRNRHPNHELRNDGPGPHP